MRIPRIPYWPLILGPWLSLGLGYALNFIVMGTNHGQMPILCPPGFEIDPGDFIHCAMTHATHLKILADWLVIRGLGIASPGDIFEWAGGFAFIPGLSAWLALVLKDYNDSY